MRKNLGILWALQSRGESQIARYLFQSALDVQPQPMRSSVAPLLLLLDSIRQPMTGTGRPERKAARRLVS